MITCNLTETKVKTKECITSQELPYPCLLRFTSISYDYIILAIGPVGDQCFKGVIVKVFKAEENNEIYEGNIREMCSMSNFGSSRGFNFYNEIITLKNTNLY